MGDCCCDPFSGGGGAITEVTGSGRIAITNPMGPVVNVDGSALIRRYVAGPAFTNAEFASVQAAVDQAVADGNGTTYGGVVIEIYPRAIGGAVVIPDSLPYFHLVAVGNGGNTGPFLTSLTINLRNADFDFSVVGFGVTTLTVNQPVGFGGTCYGLFTDMWVFGNTNMTAPDLRAFVQDCHWYGGASQFNFNGRRLTVQGCELLADVTHTWTASEDIGATDNFIIGRTTATSPNNRIEGNSFIW